MAESAEKEKPNLKICIDNTESDSENEASLVLTDASDIGEGETDQDGDNDQVEFNVRIGKTQPPTSLTTTTTKQVVESKLKPTSKVYENKAGEFIVGFDLTEKEFLEKREERAKRFGIPAKANNLNIEELHQSLGLKAEKADERGLRAEAIHMRGLDDMNTQDVFKYFQEFSPGSIEWIDDASCNVVWMDKSTACRALMKLSRSQQSIEKYLKKGQVKTGKKIQDKDEKERKNQNLKSKTPAVVESEESDDDNLDLTEEAGSGLGKQTVTPMETESETTDKDKNEDITIDDKITEKKEENNGDHEEDMEEGEISSDADSNSGSDDSVSSLYKDVNLSRVIWPPGQWRLGVPCQKSKYLFFRYATKADIKIRGAEKRSKYYVRHGNPNYGGMKGLISNSRKRQHWSRHQKEDVDDVSEGRKFDVKIPKGRELPDYSDVAMFTGETSIEEKESFDRPPARPLAAAYGSEGEESDDTEVEVMSTISSCAPSVFPKGYSQSYADRQSPLNHDRFSPLNDDSEALDRQFSDDNTNSNTAELELQKLLAVPCRSGRMYADDVEEEIKAKVQKRTTDPNDLTVVTDVRDRLSKRQKESSSAGDARQLITGKGLDLRRRLEIKRQKHTKKSSERDSPDYHSLQIQVYE